MWIKLKNDGQTIMGHHNDNSVKGYDINIPECRLIDEKGRYKYKWNGSNLIELTHNEIINHPVWKNYKSTKRINKLKEKIRELRDLNEAKLSIELTAGEKSDIDTQIATISNTSIDDTSDDL